MRDIISAFKAWFSRVFCDHNYVIEHYGNRCALERCLKCGHINQLGR
jgi:hypothetical protein